MMAVENKRINICKKIENIFRSTKVRGGGIFVLGKGKTSKAVTDYIKGHSELDTFNYIVEDEYIVNGPENEKLSNFLEISNPKNDIVIYGFSDYDRAKQLDIELFHPRGFRTFFIPLPFSYNETREYISKDFYNNNIDEFKITKSLLHIESQALFDEYIYAQITGDISGLSKYYCSLDKQYFQDECLPNLEVSFIDAGAFTGDSIKYAMKNLNIRQYVAIEPDNKNLVELEHKINEFKRGDVRFEIIPNGLSYKEEKVYFNSAGSSSCISESGQYVVNLTTLDKVAEILEKQYALFIKMDIEGAEYNAIKGGETLIKRKTPYMALSVYHKHDDLIKIPQLIENIAPMTYEYRLGYYGNNYRELVLYAIPKFKHD